MTETPDRVARLTAVPVSRPPAGLGTLGQGPVRVALPSIASPWGPLDVPQPIYDHYIALAGQQTADGQDVQAYLGFALRSAGFSAGAGTAVFFEHGMIILRPDRRVFAVYGMIYLRYRELGDVQPAGWSPGLPTSDEEGVPNGRVSHFDAADIYWSPATGAHEVHGDIAQHWAGLGGCGGWTGFPLTDESPVLQGGTQIGRMNIFQNASVYWSQPTGAAEVHGELRAAWLENFGGPGGSLGFPVSDETGSPAGTYRYNDFQHGCLTWRAADGAVQSFTALDIYVDRFTSQGVHTVGESLPIGASSIWLMVNATITASTGQSATPQFPGGGQNYGNPSASPQAQVLTISPVRGSLVITASFSGFDHSPVQGNVGLGTVTGTFAIDQEWGVGQPQAEWDPSNSFFVAYSVRNDTPADPNDPDYRQDLYWSFRNSSTPVLSQQQFGQTFVDAEADENWYQHPFNEAFYNLVYKGIAAGGLCYGMCLEANDALAGVSLYSEPLSAVPGNAAAWNEIDIKHGYQIGVNVINYVVGLFLAGQTHDPVRAFNDSQAMAAARNYPILSITQEIIGGPGHAVRPYRWDTSDPADWKIFIANPNSPPALGYGDDDPSNVIHVNPQSNTFSFAFGGPADVWTGGSWTGGRMYAMPFSIACTEQQTPVWEVALILLGAAVLILSGDAQTSQISDDHQRTFYSPRLTAPPQRWSDINQDGPDLIPGLARIPFIAGPPASPADGGRAAELAAGRPGRASEPVLRPIGQPVQLGPVSRPQPPELYWLQTAAPFGVPARPARPSPVRTTPGLLPQVAAAAITVLQAAGPEPAKAIQTDRTADPAQPAGHLTPLPVSTVMNLPPAPGLPGAVTHDIAGTGQSGYQWGIRSGASSVVATVPSQAGTTDRLSVQRPGAADQAISVTLDSSGPARAVQLRLAGTTLDGAASPRVFSLSALTLTAGQPFTVQLTPDASGIVLQNTGPAVTFTMEASTGWPAVTASRTAVPLGAGQVATITPADWTPAGLPTAPMTMQLMAVPGGPAVSERTI